MKEGFRSYRTAACNLRKSALFEKPPANLLELTSLNASNPGEGHGTHLMKQLCTEADMSGMNLMLLAQTPKLRDWYSSRFGFSVLQEEPIIMIRYAHRLKISELGVETNG